MSSKFARASDGRRRRWLAGTCVAVATAIAIGGYFLVAGRSQLVLPPGTGLLCDQRFIIVRRGEEIRVPYCANVSLDESRSLTGITHVIVVVHGSGYRARQSYHTIRRAAVRAKLEKNTIIIAPQFLKPRHIAKHHLDRSHASWSRWTTGGRSRSCDTCPPRVRSHEVVEKMVAALLSRFQLPDLRFISFVGHSAGGQFINRFSATTDLAADGVQIRFVVANPSNFLYFSEKRPRLPRVDQFAIPNIESIESCPRYNRYYYGLDKLKSHMKRLGAAGMKNRYVERNVYYLVGAQDDDSNHKELMRTCSSQLQGAHRKQRALAYINHLRDEFGARVAHQKFGIVTGVGHSGYEMLTSACAVAALFDVASAHCPFQAVSGESPR